MRDAIAVAGTAAAVVACCAVLPLVVGVIGGVSLAVVAGWTGAVIALGLLLISIALYRRREETPDGGGQ
jgi:hypothetical protein